MPAIDFQNRPATLEHVRKILAVPDESSLAPWLRQPFPIAKGSHLYCQGDEAGDVFVLLDGTLKAYQVSPDGEESIVRFCFPGEVLWTSGFQAHSRSTSVVALEKSHAVSMPDVVLQRLMTEHDSVQQRCFQLLSKIIKEEQAFIHLLAVGNADRRVAYLLTHIWRQQGGCSNTPFRIRVAMTRSDMGRYLGLSEETVSRVFSRMQSMGLIQIQHPEVDLVDLPRIEQMAHGEQLQAATV
ncbi:MAG TPA: Crp/Fnr family transcriptional regulator [Pseudomonadales bacterium]|nr:Crp/Fnr family transcriptional regulator [Pseudomonadales bacterium]